MQTPLTEKAAGTISATMTITSLLLAIFSERWDEIILKLEDTADVEVSLGQAEKLT